MENHGLRPDIRFKINESRLASPSSRLSFETNLSLSVLDLKYIGFNPGKSIDDLLLQPQYFQSE